MPTSLPRTRPFRGRIAAALVLLGLLGSAEAQTRWTLLQRNGTHVPGQDARGTPAHAVRAELEAGTAWLRRLGFRAPDVHTHTDGAYKATLVADAVVDRSTGPEAIAAYRWSDGLLTGEPLRDLWLRTSTLDSIGVDADGRPLDTAPQGDGEALATAVHEVFHGVQAAYRPPDQSKAHDWIWEGMAEAVMHEWMDVQGRPYELRETDYGAPLTTSADGGYDREHFWLSVGALLGGADRAGYLRHVLAEGGRWDREPLPLLDAALRRTAAEMGAIGPYRNGLYALYPQVLAQHAGPEHFASVTPLEIGTPSTTTVRHTLAPLSALALHVEVDVDESRLDMRGVPVRFTLDLQDRTPLSTFGGLADPRDAVHLIEGTSVAGRPALSESPYTHVVHVFGDTTLFVRVANVAERPANTEEASFVLRVESEGYYGDVVDAEGIGAPLPPGFDVRGPDLWTCRGGADARAVFDLMTPDELALDVERALPEAAQDMGDMMDRIEIQVQRLERQGRAAGVTSAQVAELRREMEARMAQARTEAQPRIDEAAAERRAEQMTRLLATFVGRAGGAECQMTLSASLTGRQGGAQILAGAVDPDRYPDGEEPGFDIVVFPPALLDQMRAMTALSPEQLQRGVIPEAMRDDPLDGWQVCTMTERERQVAREAARGSECAPVLCTEGQLVLERAEQGQISGSFQFEVLKWPEEQTGRCRVPSGRDVVSGHFNVASTDDGTDDNSLGGFGLGAGMTTTVIPGTPILDFGLE